MANTVNIDNGKSPALRVADEAIELALEERSPFPDRAAFINIDTPHMGAEIERALDEDMAIVLVFSDCSTRTLHAEPVSS